MLKDKSKVPLNQFKLQFFLKCTCVIAPLEVKFTDPPLLSPQAAMCYVHVAALVAEYLHRKSKALCFFCVLFNTK